MPDDWNPEVYEQFVDLRSRPFRDLVALALPGGESLPDGGRVLDLGCGTGALTASLADLAPGAAVTGVDSSPAMLERCAAHAGPRVTFRAGDIGTFDEPDAYDLVLSNAALHWVDDHEATLARWARALRSGGRLAVQLPANWDHPSHTVAAAVAADPYFAGRWSTGRPPAGRGRYCLTPGRYAEVLDELGLVDQQVQLRVYPQPLASSAAVVDWVRGTLLVPYRSVLAPDDAEEFERRYAAALAAEIGGPTGVRAPYFYAFERILFTARRP